MLHGEHRDPEVRNEEGDGADEGEPDQLPNGLRYCPRHRMRVGGHRGPSTSCVCAENDSDTGAARHPRDALIPAAGFYGLKPGSGGGPNGFATDEGFKQRAGIPLSSAVKPRMCGLGRDPSLVWMPP